MRSILLRVAAERRAVVFTLGAVLALNLLAYIAVVRPLGIKSAGASDRALAAAAAKTAAETDLAQARRLVEGKQEAEQELNAFYQKVLPADLVAARRMTYASLPALAERANVQYDARTTTLTDPDDGSTLGQMAITMILRGEYGDLRKFLYELERSPDFIIIDDVILTEERADEPLTLRINLSTYYRVRPSGS